MRHINVEQDVLRELRQAYDSGNLIVFAGNGISVDGGLPTWKQLATELQAHVARAGDSAGAVQEIDLLRRDESGAAVVLVALPEAAPFEGPEQALAVAVKELRHLWPVVEARFGDLMTDGLALGGLGGVPDAWWEALLTLWPTTDLVADCAPPPMAIRSIRHIDRHHGTGADLAVRDYLRALRVVAGQVILAGQAEVKALQDVWMEVEIEPRGQREADRAASRRTGQGDEDAWASSDEELHAELRDRRELVSEMAAGSLLSAEGVLRLARRVFVWGAPGTGKSTLLQWLACKAAHLVHRVPSGCSAGGPLPFERGQQGSECGRRLTASPAGSKGLLVLAWQRPR